MKTFGKYKVHDNESEYSVEVKHVVTIIPKIMLNKKAEAIISNAKSEDDIISFLKEYVKGLSILQTSINILIEL